MKFRLILTALVCFTAWMNLVQAAAVFVSNCRCVHWSKTQVNFTQIEKYIIQMEGRCPINAVVFQTVNGNTICKDPNSNWAKHVIRKLEAKTTSSPEKRRHNKRSTLGSTPSTSTKLCGAITKPRNPQKGKKMKRG
ncbi:hypothetical protein CHARACLAT_025087 [Characodon lateralis]|uniref:Chemokine interleukin-8-like domain-containing protein n=1 Tax=Characodon lateralis TaxID=208331 RepID=A0ABU7DK16_9TELE|nr:hypothetical protein [Characodon lateralis]